LRVQSCWLADLNNFSLSNSSLTAPEVTVMQAATVDGWTLPSSTSLITESPLAPHTPTLLEIRPVLFKEEASRSKVSLIPPAAPHLPTLFLADPSPSLLTPQTGHLTDPVSLATAVLQSTTVSCWSVPLTPPGSSRTPGEDHGEITASSDCPRAIHAQSAATHHIQPFDEICIPNGHSLIFMTYHMKISSFTRATCS
jgi:hypothetical protein